MRIHLFEFEDQSWFPDVIRRSMTDYLRFLFHTIDLYQPVARIINEGLENTGATQIIDLCSGGGGNIEKVQAHLTIFSKKDTKVILTDKFPNTDAFEYLKKKSNGSIDYSTASVDATTVHPELKGFRVMFSAFHHFRPQSAQAILKDAVAGNAGIAIFDGGDKNIGSILAIILLQPITFLLWTPFFKPFRLSRLLFTYIIPLIPVCTVWDGVVSILRLYTPKQLLQLAHGTRAGNYIWRSGKLRNKMGLHVTYLIGYPQKSG